MKRPTIGIDEDHDDPEDLPADADVVAPEDSHGDEEPHEDPGHEGGDREQDTRAA